MLFKLTTRAKSNYFGLSCAYTINRDDVKPPVNGHLGFLTIDDLNVYEFGSQSNSKNLMDESTIQYRLVKVSSVVCNSGGNCTNLQNFVTYQLVSEISYGKDIIFDV